MRGQTLKNAILNPRFLVAHRACILTAEVNEDLAKELMDSYPMDKPIPAVLLTTSTALMDYEHTYREKHCPEAHEALGYLWNAIIGLEELDLLTPVIEEKLLESIGEVEKSAPIDPMKHTRALFPFHQCHAFAPAHAVLAKLRFPNDSLTVLSNDLHSTVRRVTAKGKVSYIDYLVDESDIKGFEKNGGGWSELNLDDLGPTDTNEIVMRAMKLIHHVSEESFKECLEKLAA